MQGATAMSMVGGFPKHEPAGRRVCQAYSRQRTIAGTVQSHRVQSKMSAFEQAKMNHGKA